MMANYNINNIEWSKEEMLIQMDEMKKIITKDTPWVERKKEIATAIRNIQTQVRTMTIYQERAQNVRF